MYAERETFGPANLSILASKSSERVREVFAFILPLYYRSRIGAILHWSTDAGRRRLPKVDRGPPDVNHSWGDPCFRAITSASICIRGSERPAEIIMAAGRTSPKYLRSTG